MTVPVRYYCPRCGTIATLRRDAYLADKSVTPYPLEGWTYADPEEEFENADGVRLTCGADGTTGESEGVADDSGSASASDDRDGKPDAPCGEPFYLNFVRFGDGEEVKTVPERDHVRLGAGPRADGPRVPDATDGSRDHDPAGDQGGT